MHTIIRKERFHLIKCILENSVAFVHSYILYRVMSNTNDLTIEHNIMNTRLVL